MKWEELNSVFKSFAELRWSKDKRVSQDVIKTLSGEGSQGDSGLSYEVYKLSEDVYVKLRISTDSYGDNEFVAGLEFVQPKQKNVTVYETPIDLKKKLGKLSYDEILAVLQDKLDSVSEFANQDYKDEDLGLGKIVEIEQHGGEEQGSHWYSIQHFVEHDVYIKVTGYYSSYEGTDFSDGWDCCENVKPQQKTVTVYE